MGGVVKSIAKIALPAIATFALGPAGAGIFSAVGAGIAGGALGGLVAGGGLKGALLGGITGGISAGMFKGLSGKMSGMFGGLQAPGGGAAVTGQGFINQLGGGGPALSNFAQNVSSQGVGSSLAHLGKTTTAASQAARPSLMLHGGGTPAVGTAGGLQGLNYQQQFEKSQALIGKEAVATDVTKQAVGQDTIMGMTKEDLDSYIKSGFDVYEGQARQAEVEALEKNLEQYRPEYAKYYADTAKQNIEKLERGEIPEAWDTAFEEESERLERVLAAAGHNIQDLGGFGITSYKEGMGKFRQSVIKQERDYNLALAGGASTMATRIEEQRQNLASTAPAEDFGPIRDIASKAAGAVFDKLV
jgi:hypothetical protein